MAVRLEIGWHPDLVDAAGEALRRAAKEYFGLNLDRVRVLQVLTWDVDLAAGDMERLRTEIFTHPATQVSSFAPLAQDFDWAIWVGFRPGVRDNAGATAQEAAEALLGRAFPPGAAVYTSKLFLFSGPRLNRSRMTQVARELLANDMIEEFRLYQPTDWDPREGIGLIIPKVRLDHRPLVETFAIDSLETLRELSRTRDLALRDPDLPIIRDYFRRPEVLERRRQVGLGPPTDVELEYLAQARSDHCNHNTFRGRFHYRDLATGESYLLDNPFKTCIDAPTRAVAARKPWVVSVLWDNAGVGKFDGDFHYVVKAETHNSPSNLEAYGGSRWAWGPPPTWSWSTWPRPAATIATTTPSGACSITAIRRMASISWWTRCLRPALKPPPERSPGRSPGSFQCSGTTPGRGSSTRNPAT